MATTESVEISKKEERRCEGGEVNIKGKHLVREVKILGKVKKCV